MNRKTLQLIAKQRLTEQPEHKHSTINKPATWREFAPMTKIRSGDSIIPFVPYDYQSLLISIVERTPTTIVCKTRQLGMTETIVNYFLWKAIDDPAYLAVIFSRTQGDTSQIAKRIRLVIESLSLPLRSNSLLDIELQGGGRLLFRNSTKQGARGLPSVSGILYDEAAFVDHIEDIYSASIPCTSLLGDKARVIILSTPDLPTGWYWSKLSSFNHDKDVMQVCEGVRTGTLAPIQFWHDQNGIAKFFCHWSAHPKYGLQGSTYLDKIRTQFNLSEEALQREYNLSFAHSDNLVFNALDIDAVFDSSITIEEIPDFTTGCYYAGLDPSACSGNDFTAFVIIKKCFFPSDIIKVARFQLFKHESFSVVIEKISELIKLFQCHNVVIESNSIGQLFFDELQRHNFGFSFQKFSTTRSSKEALIENFNLVLRSRSFKSSPQFSELALELPAFRRLPGGRLGASPPLHDDCIIAASLSIWAIR